MIYKIESGRPMECHTSIDATKDELQYEELTPLGCLTIWKNPFSGRVMFRSLILSRSFTLLAETVTEIAESIRYLRSIGFLENKNEPE